VDLAGEPLAGATFEVCRTHGRFGGDINADECVSSTDADVEFRLEGLFLGRYTVKETAAPPRYSFDPTDIGTVELTLDAPDIEITKAFVNARLCGLGGASYGDLPANTYNLAVTIPKP
jgi:uncharacterized surface anchored protein